MWTKLAAWACAAVLLGGCGTADDSGSAATGGDPTTSSVPSTTAVGTPPTTQASRPSRTARPGAVVTLASSKFGPVLFDGSGQAIYLFGAETSGKPNCYGDCAAAWPPVLTTGRPIARGGVQGELLGVTTRRDGSSQVTYGGRPLYFYAHEGKNVVLCHNIREFGGLWLAITRTGSPAPT